jgi:GT2 family glycosyltransferase
MLLSIIIVNFNTKNLLRKCLSAVEADLEYDLLDKKCEVIVVDNGSADASCEMIEKKFKNVKLIRNHKNTGFASANNTGIKRAKGEYVLLLNSDTEIKKGAIFQMFKVLDNDNKIGVVGCKLRNYDNSVQQSFGYFPNLFKVFLWMSFLDDLPFFPKLIKPYHVTDLSLYDNFHEVDWVSGACFMFNKELIRKAGLMDENIFMYGEELEWCFRIKKAGYKICFIPDAEVIHSKGASAEKDNRNAGIIEEFKSLIYFYKKHKSPIEEATVKYIIKYGALLRIVLFAIIRKYNFRIPAYVKTIKVV